MAIVRDKGRDTAVIDKRLGGTYDLQAVQFVGAIQSVTIGAASVQSNPFSNRCRAIRLAPTGNIRYLIGANPTAVATSVYLAGGAVEVLPVTGGQRIAIIQDGAATGTVSIQEDM
jgi:hypothetical protein